MQSNGSLPSPDNTVTPEAVEQIDARWIKELDALTKQYSSCGALSVLDLSKKQQDELKQKFLEDPSFIPDFTVRDAAEQEKFSLQHLDDAEKGYMKLKERILVEEQNEAICAYYLWRLNEKIAWIRMIRASQNQNMHQFQQYANFLYQKPDKNLDNLSLQLLYDGFEKLKKEEPPEALKQAITELENKLPDQPSQPPEVVDLPPPDLVAAVRDQIRQRCQKLMPEVIPPQDQLLTLEEITKYFTHALNTLGYEGWEVIVDEKRPNILVRSEKKQLVLPQRYEKQLTFDRISELIYHEIATHILRYEKGRISNLTLLGKGLDRYIESEEGLATLSEHMALDREVENFSKQDRFLAVTLAMGLQGKKYTFREVFETMKAYYYYENLKQKCKNGVEIDEAQVAQLQQSAEDKAWDICVRVYRGTNCGGPEGKDLGVCFSKDMLYYKGNMRTWQLISRQKDATFIQKLFVGKFAHNDPRHWILLLQTGTLDQEGLDIDTMFAPEDVAAAKQVIAQANRVAQVRKTIKKNREEGQQTPQLQQQP